MIIALDAMGGDNAPAAIVEGAVLAARHDGTHIALVGDRDVIAEHLANHDIKGLPITIRHASQAVGMDESPSTALRRKRDSSMRVAVEMVKNGEASAAISAGNSGAFMAKALLVLRPLPGLERPTFATQMPSVHGPRVMLDVGANVECKPLHLAQFAIMGEVYAKYMLEIDSPRVGILSNGQEVTKGTDLTRATHEMLSQMKLNYVGYVEGRDLFIGDVDVVVTDGFTGNIVLKTSEGVSKAITDLLRQELSSNIMSKLGYLLSRRAFQSLKKRIDYREIGGAPLLGINGPALICHGSSNATAIRNAVRVAGEFVERHVILKMMQHLEQNEDRHHWGSKKEKRFWSQIKEKFRHPAKKEDEPEA